MRSAVRIFARTTLAFLQPHEQTACIRFFCHHIVYLIIPIKLGTIFSFNLENSDNTKTQVTAASPPPPEADHDSNKQSDALSAYVNNMKICDDPRAKLKSWLCKTLKFVITDNRVIVGLFVCTDRDGNVILENACEYTNATDDDKSEPRVLGLALVPGKHIVSVSLCVLAT